MHLRLVVWLSHEALHYIRAGTQAGDTAQWVQCFEELEFWLRRRAWDVMVLDPRLLGGASETAVRRRARDIVRASAPTPVMLYGALSRALVWTLMETAPNSPVKVMLPEDHRTPTVLRRELETTAASSLPQRVLTALAPQLRSLPESLHDGIRDLFSAKDQPPSLERWAAATGRSVRSIERWLSRAGLASPHAFVTAARVIMACHYLGSRKVRLARIAQRIGLDSTRRLNAQFHQATGLSARQVRESAHPRTVALLVARRLRSPEAEGLLREAEYNGVSLPMSSPRKRGPMA